MPAKNPEKPVESDLTLQAKWIARSTKPEEDQMNYQTLLTAADIQHYLRIGKTCFYQNVKPKLPPPIQLGRHPRWKPEDVAKFLQDLAGVPMQ